MRRPNLHDAAYLWDMLESARAIQDFVRDMELKDYLADAKTQSAVERKLELIGESARKVSSAFRAAVPEIPWREIIGQRNILAHDYGLVENDLVWETATVHVPTLIRQLAALLPPDPGTDP